ncbi:MAG: polysulfide reductase NrfD [Calditrichaeota bacterium]|nr:polysulfide reductase NrfD [Calditrichota bacterium]
MSKDHIVKPFPIDQHSDVNGVEQFVSPDISLKEVSDKIIAPMEGKISKYWWLGLFISLGMLAMLAFSLVSQLMNGYGQTGITNPIGWGVYITDFVFWVGIGHAGTLISAILFLFRQRWRNSINRASEAMTIYAVMCAGLFPLIHTGRIWVDFWLVPYPNSRELWINFRSPLLWDVFAVSTYFTISLLFWYQGLIPDFATLRDRAKTKIRRFIYGYLSMGWKGSARDWNHYEAGYAQFAWIAAPLVLSVHSIVSFDFAVSLIPGWHTTIFPPYFVAGAVFSGFGMVQTLLVIARKAMKLEDLITINHIELMNKVILVTSSIVGYAYLMEFYMAWFSQETYEQFLFFNTRFKGPFAWAFWIMFSCNVIIPMVLWKKSWRRNLLITWIISIFINIGMWFERFNIVVTSLHRDFLPPAWDYYSPTIFEWLTTIGSFGLFFTMFFIFLRVFPSLSIAEVKAVLPNPLGNRKRKYETAKAE